MLASSPIPKHTVGRTFFVAIITLGVATLVQIGAVCWAYIARSHSTTVETHLALRGMPTMTDSQMPRQQPGFLASLAQANPSPAPAVPKPTPVPPQGVVNPPSPTQARLNELLDQATVLIERGDMSTALIRLREAQALAPDDPKVLSELADAYEKLGSDDKAMELWQHIFSIGKSAGSYYDMAFAKLNPAPAGSGQQAGFSKLDAEGFPTGSVLALVDISKEDSPDSSGKQFTIKVPVKARPGAQIDVNDVGMVVLFYEQLDDQSIVLNNAEVVPKWITSPVDWSKNDIQVLQVKYKAASLDPKIKHPEHRTYFGYIVRVYYKGSLQDVRAEPAGLLKQFPPPLTLQNEETQ